MIFFIVILQENLVRECKEKVLKYAVNILILLTNFANLFYKELSKKKLSFLFNEIKVPLLEFIPALTLNSRNEILSLSKIIKKNYCNFQIT